MGTFWATCPHSSLSQSYLQPWRQEARESPNPRPDDCVDHTVATGTACRWMCPRRFTLCGQVGLLSLDDQRLCGAIEVPRTTSRVASVRERIGPFCESRSANIIID